MRRYFVRHLDTAIVESPMTAQAAERYSEANGWTPASEQIVTYIWSCRDATTLYRMKVLAWRAWRAKQAAMQTAPLARAVGHTL